MDEQNQYCLDFTGTEKENWAYLRTACRKLPKTPLYTRVRFLLELVHGVAGSEAFTWPLDDIGDRLGAARRTVQRTIHRAREVNLITTRRQRRDDGSLGRTEIRINWRGVREYEPTSDQIGLFMSDSGNQAPAHAPPQAPCASSCTNHAPVRAQTMRQNVTDKKSLLKSLLKSPSSSNRSNELAHGGTDWEVVVGRLVGLGVGTARRLVGAVRDRLSPEHVEALIDHYEQGEGWDAGALAWRIENAEPGEEASERWPVPKVAKTRPKVSRERAIQSMRYRLIRDHKVPGANDFTEDQIVAKWRELQSCG